MLQGPKLVMNDKHAYCDKASFKWIWLVGWLCLTSHQQRGHLEMAPPFTVPCEGRDAR